MYTIPPEPIEHPFYVGIGISRDAGHFVQEETDLTFLPGQTTPVNTERLDFDWSADGTNGELFIGYRLLLPKQFQIALEVSGTETSNRGDFLFTNAAQNLVVRSKVGKDYSYGVSLLPGYIFKHVALLYLRIGYSRARFFLEENRIPNPPPARTLFNIKQNRNGYVLGIGLQYFFDPCFAIRLEYDREYYEELSQDVANPVFVGDVLGRRTGELDVRPEIDEYTLSLAYYFG